jgi:hypothetical protein
VAFAAHGSCTNRSVLSLPARCRIAYFARCVTVDGLRFHPLTQFRIAAQVIPNTVEAERRGFAAFVIGHFQEPGLHESKVAVALPVMGLGTIRSHVDHAALEWVRRER